MPAVTLSTVTWQIVMKHPRFLKRTHSFKSRFQIENQLQTFMEKNNLSKTFFNDKLIDIIFIWEINN